LASPVQSPFALAFKVPGYRWLWVNALFTAATFTVETLSQGWLMLLLTNSPFWVGLAAGMRGASQAVFSIPAGFLADRLDRRKILIVTQCIGAVATLTVGVLVLTHIIRPWHMFVYVILAGAVYSANRPCVNGLIYDVVGESRLLNASALQSMAGSIFRIFGALAGGIIIDKLGVGQNYLFVSTCYLAGTGALLLLKSPATIRWSAEPLFGGVAAGLRYAMRSRQVRHLLTLSFMNEAFGFSFFTMLPVMARDVLRVGGIGMGYLTAMSGVGQLAATLRIAARGDMRNKGRMLVAAALGFGIFVTLFGLSPWFLVSLAFITLIGFTSSTYDATMATAIQLTASDRMRGRILGLYSVTLSLSPLGGLVTGTVAALLNTPLAVALSGIVVIGGALGLYRGIDALDSSAENVEARAPSIAGKACADISTLD
jgi:MFS family permease